VAATLVVPLELQLELEDIHSFTPIKPPAPPNHRWIPGSQWLGSLGDPAAGVRADSSQCQQPPGLSLIWGVVLASTYLFVPWTESRGKESG
jgi:hypothetical protein